MIALFYFLFLTVLVPLIQADRIIMNEPAKGSRFKPGSIMNIDYTVRFEGMAKLGSASVSILYPNHTVITFLPEGNWMDSPDGKRGASASWTIPSDLEEGEYRLRISGPAVYMCSENNNGQPPYTRCKMSMHRTRTFIVEDGDGTNTEAENNEDDQDDNQNDENQDDMNSDIDQGEESIDNQQEGQDVVYVDDQEADSESGVGNELI